MAILAQYVLISSWSIFWVYWLVAWFNVKRTVERQSAKSRWLVAWAVGFGVVFLVTSHGRRIIPKTDLFSLISIAFSVGGVAIAVWARHTLAGNWSATVTFKEGHELIQRGPYGFVRHPIYTGFLSMMLAWAIIYGHLRGFMGVALTALGFWFKLRVEEAMMTKHFPDAYPTYKSRVKALVPWIL